MQNMIDGDVSVPSDEGNDGFYLILSNLVALIDHIQASTILVETAQAQETAGEQQFANIVVLDDVTPLYARAGAALQACERSLSEVLRILRETKAPTPR